MFAGIWHKACAKSRSCRGESITEALVATLIGGLAALMLFTAVSAASNVVISSRAAMGDYYADNNRVAEQSGDELGFGRLVAVSEDGSELRLAADEINVAYFDGGQVGSAPVVVYAESETP